jgi:hypothetical protein
MSILSFGTLAVMVASLLSTPSVPALSEPNRNVDPRSHASGSLPTQSSNPFSFRGLTDAALIELVNIWIALVAEAEITLEKIIELQNSDPYFRELAKIIEKKVGVPPEQLTGYSSDKKLELVARVVEDLERRHQQVNGNVEAEPLNDQHVKGVALCDAIAKIQMVDPVAGAILNQLKVSDRIRNSHPPGKLPAPQVPKTGPGGAELTPAEQAAIEKFLAFQNRNKTADGIIYFGICDIPLWIAYEVLIHEAYHVAGALTEGGKDGSLEIADRPEGVSPQEHIVGLRKHLEVYNRGAYGAALVSKCYQEDNKEGSSADDVRNFMANVTNGQFYGKIRSIETRELGVPAAQATKVNQSVNEDHQKVSSDDKLDGENESNLDDPPLAM